MRKFIREYFSFSPSEIRAIIILSVLIFISLVVRLFFPIPETQSYRLNQKEQATLDSFMNSLEMITYESDNYLEPSEYQYNSKETEIIPIYSSFDPNTISQTELEKMNFPPIIARNLIRFREAGGKFYKKNDFRKLYGITDSMYSVLEEYIIISGDKEVDTISSKVIEKQLVELNTADSSELLSINGIGPYFAGKIVNFREKLGGYYKIEQLLDIKGLDSTKFVSIRNQIQLNTTLIKKIDLNSISVSELKSHPYISFRLAESIIKYREFRKGKVDLNELLENHVITNRDFERLSPYFHQAIR